MYTVYAMFIVPNYCPNAAPEQTMRFLLLLVMPFKVTFGADGIFFIFPYSWDNGILNYLKTIGENRVTSDGYISQNVTR